MISLKSESMVDKFGQMYFRVSYKDGDNLIEKDVSLNDYRRLINESLEEDMVWVDVPKLPVEVYKAKVSSRGEVDGYKVILFVKGQMQPFNFAGKIMRIPFPSLVFNLTVGKGIIKEKKVFAVKDEILCPDTELFHYPFGNVNDQGGICMGNILVDMPTIQDSVKFVDAFMEGRTNSDLLGVRNRLGYTQSELVEKIQKMEKYPDEFLIPNKKILKDLF